MQIVMTLKWSVVTAILTHINFASAKREYALSNKHLKIAYHEYGFFGVPCNNLMEYKTGFTDSIPFHALMTIKNNV